VLALHGSGLEDQFRYCEGWVYTEQMLIPIQHAWLLHQGDIIVDLTLSKDQVLRYGEYRSLPAQEAREKIAKRERFGPLLDLMSFGPYVNRTLEA
jgi:hypothetical protein